MNNKSIVARFFNTFYLLGMPVSCIVGRIGYDEIITKYCEDYEDK